MPKGGITHKEYKEQRLADPDFRREYEALSPHFQILRSIIIRRNQLRLSQNELAQRVGTKQPAISRLENGRGDITLRQLLRLAEALDAELDVQFKDKQSAEPKTKVKALA